MPGRHQSERPVAFTRCAQLRRRALDTARFDQSKRPLTAKLKRAGWDDQFMLKLLSQMR
jgi:hypothetical protein